MKLYKVKLDGQPLMIVTGEIVLFDGAVPIAKKDNVHYFNASHVVYIIDADVKRNV